MTQLTVLHPGAMGAAVAAHAVGAGHRVLWCPRGRGSASGRRAERAGFEGAELAEAVATSDIVLSVCPPAAAEDVARSVAGLGCRGLFVDANAISPERMERIAGMMRDSGASAVLDAAIIGPPPEGGATARLYVAGGSAPAAEVAAVFAGTGVDVRLLDRPLGAASALKMGFAHYSKILRTLVGPSHALAASYGVHEALVEEGRLMAAAALADPGYLPSVAARAWRWQPEMLEVATTLRTAGLPAELAEAAAAVLGRWDGVKDRFDLPLEEVLELLRRAGG